MSDLNRAHAPKTPLAPNANPNDGHLTGRILRDLFGGKHVTSVEFKGERIFFAHEIGAHLGYNDPRYLVTIIKREWADEMKAGTHFIKIEGDDLNTLRGLFASDGSSLANANPDGDDIRDLISPKTRSLLMLTPTGLRRACVLCGTKEGVAFRDWLDTVLDKLDATGSYTLPPDPQASRTRSPDTKRAPLTQAEREAKEAARIEREKRASGKLLLKYLPQLREGAPHVSDASFQTFQVKALEMATGHALPLRQFLPVLEEPRWYSPSDLAHEWGVTSQRVGLAITAAGDRAGLDLRTDARYSRCILNQSTTSAKQVPSYLYNDAGRALILAELRVGGHLPTSHTHDGRGPHAGHNSPTAPKRLASPDLSPTRAEAPARRPHTHSPNAGHNPNGHSPNGGHNAEGQGYLLPQAPARPTRPRLDGDNTLAKGGDTRGDAVARREGWFNEGRLMGHANLTVMMAAKSARQSIAWVPSMAPVRGVVEVVRRYDTGLWLGWAGVTGKHAANVARNAAKLAQLERMREVLDVEPAQKIDPLALTHEGLMMHFGVYEVLVDGLTYFLVTLPDARALRLLWADDASAAEVAARCVMLGVMVLPEDASAKIAQMAEVREAYPLPHVAALPLGSLLADWAGDDTPAKGDRDDSPAHVKARLRQLLHELERAEVF